MSLSEEEAESKSDETSEESAEEDDAGVRSYNEKFNNLNFISTDVIHQKI